MKAVVQRVSRAGVEVAGETVGAIERGFLVLVGFGREDEDETLAWMARKIVTLRIFEDESGRMTVSNSAGALMVTAPKSTSAARTTVMEISCV